MRQKKKKAHLVAAVLECLDKVVFQFWLGSEA
jgi:hypothetical protein